MNLYEKQEFIHEVLRGHQYAPLVQAPIWTTFNSSPAEKYSFDPKPRKIDACRCGWIPIGQNSPQYQCETEYNWHIATIIAEALHGR